MDKNKRVFHDPIHKEIILDISKEEELMVMELIETFAFQRLRRIKQLGPAYLVFHGAESSRFTHSIGVFFVARKILNHLSEQKKEFKKNKFILYAAALLHDLGHGPLSHTSESILSHDHEAWSKKLILNYSPINSILKKYDQNLPEKISNLFASKSLFSNPLKMLISSEIDCDRLDYLLRDSYNTGTKYGLVDLGRIISALTFAPDGCIAIRPKGLMAIEHFLILRNLMYRTIYNHRINEICSWILETIILNIKSCFGKEVWLDNCMRKWIFSPKDLDFKDFLSNDDVRFYYHLNVWKENGPKPISTLAKMYIDRDLPKASDISSLSNIKKLEILAFAKRRCKDCDYDPSLFCGLKNKTFNGFESHNSLRLWNGHQLSSLESESNLIKTLMHSNSNTLIIYPKELREDVETRILELNHEQ